MAKKAAARSEKAQKAHDRAAAATRRAAGANTGNEPAGKDDAGSNEARRRAQSGDPASGGDEADEANREAGMSEEQIDMERQRREDGAAERGTGDKPPAVHGRTRHVLTASDRTQPLYADEAQPRSRGKQEAHQGDRTVEAGTRVKRTRKVRALKLGYYDNKRRRLGDVFLIREPYKVLDEDAPKNKDGSRPVKQIDEFSDRWMEDVPDHTPTRTTTGKEALRDFHDQTLGQRAVDRATGGPATGDANPIGGDDDSGDE